MILVDTSVWINHLRHDLPALRQLLEKGRVLCHPSIVGELAMGSLRKRSVILSALEALPRAEVAREEEVLGYVTDHSLFGIGIGYIDAHLLASAQLTSGSRLWTSDKRLQEVATKLDLAYDPVPLST